MSADAVDNTISTDTVDETDDSLCVICLEPLTADKAELLCGHSFHAQCLPLVDPARVEIQFTAAGAFVSCRTWWRLGPAGVLRNIKCPLCRSATEVVGGNELLVERLERERDAFARPLPRILPRILG